MAAKTNKTPKKATTRKSTTKAKPKVLKAKENKTSLSAAIESPKSKRNLKSKKRLLGGLLLVVLLLLLAFRYKGLFVASIVNGKPIWRVNVVDELEKRTGAQVLDELITKELVNQEIKKSGVTVTDEELNQEKDRISEIFTSQGYTLDAALAQEGMTMDDFKENLYVQLAAKKVIQDKVSVTDEEVKEYFDQNSELYEGQKLEDVDSEIRGMLSESKLSQELSTWVAGIKAQADIKTYVDY